MTSFSSLIHAYSPPVLTDGLPPSPGRVGPLLGRDEEAFEERHPERQSRKPIATADRDAESRHCYGAASFQSTRPASHGPAHGAPEAAPASSAHAPSRSAAQVEGGRSWGRLNLPLTAPPPSPTASPESARFPERQVKFHRLFWFTKLLRLLWLSICLSLGNLAERKLYFS